MYTDKRTIKSDLNPKEIADIQYSSYLLSVLSVVIFENFPHNNKIGKYNKGDLNETKQQKNLTV